jgi:hypothetical protein
MAVVLRLLCDPVLGGRVDRETSAGMLTVATVVRDGPGLLVRLRPVPEGAGLEYLDGLRAEGCDDLQARVARAGVTVTMPNV